MFSWGFARSAEAVFSRWAVKRLCKFALKKKLGQFILGDIDLDQLDVQLSQGTIQLTDLAINVDYLNDKFGAATPVIIKEGSIGSLSVKMPWKGRGFEVEVEELEIVLMLRLKNKSLDGEECTISGQDSNHDLYSEVGKPGHDKTNSDGKFGTADVHEGVKTIAKMVKWFLANFSVKVKNLIVAFEPYSEKDRMKDGCPKTLVLRISESECGTCVSEDDNLNSHAKAGSFLGISRLTNFVKFQGGIVELLKMDDVDNQACSPRASCSGLGELFLGQCPSIASTVIMTGKGDGFSGNLKLSIPWKNGSLDIRKVDAEVCIDPVELRFHPSTIKWFLILWEACKNLGMDSWGGIHCRSTDSIYLNSASHFHSTYESATIATHKATPVSGGASSASVTGQELLSEAMLPGSHLIPDWVPNSIEGNGQAGIQEEVDLGASVDQFFECLDGMRNSQSALGSSGMWNWTCSVFSALTAASSLASGSLHIPSEQQHVQTKLKATLAGISIMLSFQDEELEHLCHKRNYHNNVSSHLHYLGAECKDITVVLRVCPQERRFDGTVKYIEVADYIHNENVMNLQLQEGISDSNHQTVSIQNLQVDVLGVLPPFGSSSEDSNSDELIVASGFPVGNIIKIKYLVTSGVTHCQFIVKSDSSNGSLTGTMSFSLQLPHFVLWVNFWSVKMLVDLMKAVEKSVEMNSPGNEFPCVTEKHMSSSSDGKKGSHLGAGKSSSEVLHGNILVPNARVILCFPLHSGKDTGGYPSWDQFIAIDFTSPSTAAKRKVQDTSPLSDINSWRRHTSRAALYLQLNLGDSKIYLVNLMCENVGNDPSDLPRQKFCAHQILSVSSRDSCLSTINMLWQEGCVTGPWLADKAKSFATSEESRSIKRFKAKGLEFATVTSMKDVEDTNSQLREEMILSSAFFLHVYIFPVFIDLDRSPHYGNLRSLIDQVTNALSGMACDAVSVSEASSVPQASILMECESVEILIRPDIKEEIKGSLQNELPGSWDCFKLKVCKFELLSVSNIGGIRGATLFWLAHGEGKLWGSITGVPDQEFLLISCSNSAQKRGDGGGSNVLSSGLAGSDIVHVWDPKNFHGFTSIVVRCSTLVAVGGRLDWLEAISSFFSLPSAEVEYSEDDILLKADANAPCGTSFVLKLVDAGLSYEPYLNNSEVKNPLSDTDSSYMELETGEPNVACLLAASSFTLSSSTIGDSVDNDYRIRVQDLGLLLCLENENLGCSYNVEYLHEMGYVKVAREALIEAVLSTNCKNGLLWELRCSKSHIYVETCHDTTSGLMRLAAQLQQLFAPDLEESAVHLQTRWNNVHQVQERNELDDDDMISELDSGPSTSEGLGVVGLMDEISEDAFHLHRSKACQIDSSDSQVCVSLDENLLGDSCCPSIETPDILSVDISLAESVPRVGLEGSPTAFLHNGYMSELIEGYCLSEPCPLSELSIGRQSSSEIHKCRSKNSGDRELGRGNSGWYGDTSLSIVENHIAEASGEDCMNQFLQDKLLSMDCTKPDDFGKPIGRIILKNISLTWKMCNGSDWREHNNHKKPSKNVQGRDTTICLELELSGLQFQYDFFPTSGMCASKLSLSVQDFYLCDRSKSAPWKKVLGYYRSKDHPRESSSKAFKMELEAVRPDSLTPLEEYRLRIAFLPMRLHLHQSQLDFIISFFGSNGSLSDQSSDHHQTSCGAKPSSTKTSVHAGHTLTDEALLPYFQKFDIWPIILRVDYCPSHVDLAALSGGKYVELVNLVPWKGVELQLKHVHAVGVYGWGSVCETTIGEWLEEISQNQMHKVLRGLPPIRSLVAVGSGAAKLVSLPVESYRKDQRVLKGMQRGAVAFLRSISLEAVGLGVHLAAGAHDILLQAECIVTSISPQGSHTAHGRSKPSVQSNQPKDAQQGIQQAYECLSDGLGKSASALVRTPLKKYQRGASAGSALATAVRAVPAAAIAPVAACASAAHCALLGLRNSLDPEHKRESMEKYLGPTKPRD